VFPGLVGPGHALRRPGAKVSIALWLGLVPAMTVLRCEMLR